MEYETVEKSWHRTVFCDVKKVQQSSVDHWAVTVHSAVVIT